MPNETDYSEVAVLKRMLGNAVVLLQGFTDKYQNGQYDMGTSWVVQRSKMMLGYDPEWDYDGS